MNAKTAKLLRLISKIRNDNVLNRSHYRGMKKKAKAHAQQVSMSKVSSTMPGIPSSKMASKSKGLRKKQPSYGPEIAKWGVNRDRVRKTHGPMFSLPSGLSFLTAKMFARVGLVSE